MNDLPLINNLPFELLDLMLIIIIFVSAILAYSRGFVHEILSVTSWGGAIAVTFYGLPYLRPYAQSLIETDQKTPPYQMAIDFGIGFLIFISTIILLSFFTQSISKKIQKSILNSLDNALGFLFGIVRGSLFICIIYIGVEFFLNPINQPAWLKSAKSMKLIIPAVNAIKSVIPKDFDMSPLLDASDSVKEETEKLLDAREAFDKIISPKPKSETKQREGTYDRRERQDMERLIDTKELGKDSN